MPSIEKSPYPLVFKVASSDDDGAGGGTGVGTEVRALEGMQKEALVRIPGAFSWRMVSDEGPYLDGTDLAPFPLAFFTAGTQLSLLSTVARAARAREVPLQELRVVQDNRYSMSGSFLKGDAIGGAMPAEAVVQVGSAASEGAVRDLVERSEALSSSERTRRRLWEGRGSRLRLSRTCRRAWGSAS
jgi:hypothetical protein